MAYHPVVVLKNTFLQTYSATENIPLTRFASCPAAVACQKEQIEESFPDDSVEIDSNSTTSVTPCFHDPYIQTTYTTIMLRNIPNKYSQAVLLTAVNNRGFYGKYDFFYLPVDFKNGANMGYAFINFTTHENAVRFMEVFRGLRLPALRSAKVCDVSWARIQSLVDNVEHYRNNPINSLADPIFRPLLFREGLPVEFPRPDRMATRNLTRRTTITESAYIPGVRMTSSCYDKIFIGGISAETTAEQLQEYFAQFGTIIECAIVRDRKTSCSRGFAFCCFTDTEAVNRVLAVRQHLILGQSVGVRRYSIKK